MSKFTHKRKHEILPFVKITFLHPTPAAALIMVPRFPGSLTLSQIIVRGIESVIMVFSRFGRAKIPVMQNKINIFI